VAAAGHSSFPDRDVEDASAESIPRSPTVNRRAFGRFHVLGTLGEGGLGTVYEAYDATLARRVALKVVRAKSETLPEVAKFQQAQLIREAQSLARLAHPNVVTIYDVGTTDDHSVYLAMELVVGRTLKEAWTDANATRAQRLVWLTQAGRGLAAAHNAGLIHRDVKPGNILVANDQRVLLLDFGLAQNHDRVLPGQRSAMNDVPVPPVEAIEGTPAYMAPEQIAGQACTVATDIFAFCCVVFEVLAGEAPFPKDHLDARAQAIAKGIVKWPAAIPPSLRPLLAQGFQPDPRERGANLNALLVALDQLAVRPSQRAGLGALVLLALSLAVFTTIGMRPNQVQMHRGPCESPETALASEWNEEIRQRLQQSFAATSVQGAPRIWDRTATMLATWRDEWQQSLAQVCSLDSANSSNADRIVVEEMRGCLADARAEFVTLIDIWRTATAKQVLDSVAAATSLSAPAECLDREALMKRAPLPVLPDLRRAIQELRTRVRAVEILIGQYELDRARTAIEAILADPKTSDDPPLLADVIATRAWIAYLEGDAKLAAGTWLRRASLLAVLANRPSAAVSSLGRFWFAEGYQRYRFVDVADTLKLAVAEMERGGAPPHLQAFVAHLQAIELTQIGQHLAAIERMKFALEQNRLAGPQRVSSVARNLDALGVTYSLAGDHRHARYYYNEALQLRLRVMGQGHPDTLLARHYLAASLLQSDEPLLAQLESLTALRDCLLESGEFSACAEPQRRTIGMLIVVGRYAAALDAAQNVMTVESSRGRRTEPGAPWTKVEAARILDLRGESDAAWPLALSGLADLRAESAVHPESLIANLEVVAALQRRVGDLDGARASIEELHAILKPLDESRLTLMPRYLYEAAENALAVGDPQAIDFFEAAIAEQIAAGPTAVDLAALHRGLAQALLDHGETGLAWHYAHLASEELANVDGMSNHMLVNVAHTVAQIELAMKRPDEALVWLEYALSVFDFAEVAEHRLAPLYWTLAQIHVAGEDSKDAKVRARRAADLALRLTLAAGREGIVLAKKIRAWMKTVDWRDAT
jgi:serine/threonine protein kinase